MWGNSLKFSLSLSLSLIFISFSWKCWLIQPVSRVASYSFLMKEHNTQTKNVKIPPKLLFRFWIFNAQASWILALTGQNCLQHRWDQTPQSLHEYVLWHTPLSPHKMAHVTANLHIAGGGSFYTSRGQKKNDVCDASGIFMCIVWLISTKNYVRMKTKVWFPGFLLCYYTFRIV